MFLHFGFSRIAVSGVRYWKHPSFRVLAFKWHCLPFHQINSSQARMIRDVRLYVLPDLSSQGFRVGGLSCFLLQEVLSRGSQNKTDCHHIRCCKNYCRSECRNSICFARSHINGSWGLAHAIIYWKCKGECSHHSI